MNLGLPGGMLSCSTCPTICNPMDCRPPCSCPWNFPGKNTGVDGNFLLQGIFPTQGLNPGLLHLPQWWVDSLPLHHLPNQALIISDKKPSLIVVILFQPNLVCLSDFTAYTVTLKLNLFHTKNFI